MGRLQAFPILTWKEEFKLAEKIGFELIEWVLDSKTLHQNPIFDPEGRKEISLLKNKHNIDIPSICCDCLMDTSLTSVEKSIRSKATGYLLNLIDVCSKLNIKYIELPLVGDSEVKTNKSIIYLSSLINEIAPLLDKTDTFILLELNLEPKKVFQLLRELDSDRVLINYDTGNSAYWGFNPEEEIPLYGDYIANIHIKDCTQPDYSVYLGTGDVDFNNIFKLLKESRYRGDFILQASREKEDYLAAKEFFNFTDKFIKEYLNEI